MGQYGSEKMIAAFVQGQGGKSEYCQLHTGQMDLALIQMPELAPGIFLNLRALAI